MFFFFFGDIHSITTFMHFRFICTKQVPCLCWYLQTNLILLSSKQLTLNNNILWSSSYDMGHLRRTIVEISSAQNCSPHTCLICDHNNGPTVIRVGNHHKFKFNKANHNNVPTMIRSQQSPLTCTGYMTKIHKIFNTF